MLAALFLEEDVVIGVGVEGRVEIDEVNAGVGDVVAQDVQIVTEVEFVLPVSGGNGLPSVLGWRDSGIAGCSLSKGRRRLFRTQAAATHPFMEG